MQSVDLADRITLARRRNYGTKKAAYTAAGVNAATWDKAEAGDAINLREDTLARIVRTLWPASGGDWRAALDGSVGGDGQDYVAHAGQVAPAAVTNEQVLEAVMEMRREFDARLRRLEGDAAESVEGAGQD